MVSEFFFFYDFIALSLWDVVNVLLTDMYSMQTDQHRSEYSVCVIHLSLQVKLTKSYLYTPTVTLVVA